MRGSRPRILITGPDRGGFAMWAFTWLAVLRAGGRPIRMKPKRFSRLSSFEGLVLGGGADVDPALYGGLSMSDLKAATQEERQRSRWTVLFWGLAVLLSRKLFSLGYRAPVDEERDRVERSLLDQALAAGRPVLGICRGAQLMNVAQGGNLHQSIAGFYIESPKVDTVFPRKTVVIDPASRLADVIGSEDARVNSLHNQAVNKLGREVKVVARERNGIAQGIELGGHDFAIGIQWHPEFLPQSRRQQRLFHALVSAARVHQQRAMDPATSGISHRGHA